MSEISKAWVTYVNKMSKIDSAAIKKVESFIGREFNFTDASQMQKLIDYCYSISTAYGESAAALACEMYDSIGLASNVLNAAAIPAETASYTEVAYNVKKAAQTQNGTNVANQVGRFVKRTGADTMLKNAIRDRAEFAWIPHGGETCAFCLTLASNGWRRASKSALKGNHAEHIHSNCKCQYAIRFNRNTEFKGYNPDKYYQDYKDASGHTAEQKIKALRREHYDLNAEKIKQQHREAYAKRQEIENSTE